MSTPTVVDFFKEIKLLKYDFMRCENERDGVILENSEPVLVLLLISSSSLSVEDISSFAKAILHSIMAWENKLFHWESLLTYNDIEANIQ